MEEITPDVSFEENNAFSESTLDAGNKLSSITIQVLDLFILLRLEIWQFKFFF